MYGIHDLIRESINPALQLLPPVMDSISARIQLCATAVQESRIEVRKQIKGPAVSFYQFEKIGIQDVLERATSAQHAKKICDVFDVAPEVNAIYALMQKPEGDILASAFARLNYWNDRAPLPSHTAPVSVREAAAWAYYIKVWRPGKPHLSSWPMAYWRAYGANVG